MTEANLLIFREELFKAIQESNKNPNKLIQGFYKIFDKYGLSDISIGAKKIGTTIVLTPQDTISQFCMATIFDTQMFDSLDIDINLEK